MASEAQCHRCAETDLATERSKYVLEECDDLNTEHYLVAKEDSKPKLDGRSQ